MSKEQERAAKEYLGSHCRLLPSRDIGRYDTESEKAFAKHARNLKRKGAPAEWAIDMLIACSSHAHSDQDEQDFIRRVVEHQYKVADLLPLDLVKLDRVIEPTPCDWVDGAALPVRKWLFKPIYIRGFIGLCVATGGIGKTSLGLVECASIVTGRPLLGTEPSEENLTAWYWNGEDPREEMQRRWAAVLKHYDIKKGDIRPGSFYMDSGRDLPVKLVTVANGAAKVAEPLVSEMVRVIKEKGINVLCIDPFVSSHTVSENDTAAIQMVVEQWASIANETGCCIVLWHHTRKTGGQNVTIEDSRGASALFDAARGRRALNKMSSAEAKGAGVPETQRGRYFWADCSLTSMIPPSERRDWFKLESVNLGNGELGDGDEVGVVVHWDHPAASELDVSDEQHNAAFEAIEAGGHWRADARAKAWIGHPIAKALGLDVTDAVSKKKINELVSKWEVEERLERYIDQDERRKEKEFIRAKEF